MKFFKKYYLVLPPVALIYGIYILNIKYPYDGFPQTLMDSIINGWLLIWVLFAALSGGIIYQLQQSKKQQYIYSLPWTKKDIYKKKCVMASYITDDRRDHLWNFLCSKTYNDPK